MQLPNRNNGGGFNFASAITGFAIGAIVTFIAVIQFVPAERSSNGANLTELSSDGSGELGSGELLEGEAGTDAAGVQGGTSRSSTGGARGATGGSTTRSGGTAAGATGTTVPGRAGGGASGGANVGGGGTGGSTGTGTGGGSAQCAAGKNGGVTDTGVDATSIKLGATVAESGIAKSFLGQVRQGMEAQIKKVNRDGGICGRQLKVIYKDDGWNPETGARYLQNLVEGDKVFALAVSPSSEGLNQASNQGYFRSQNVPVVGADGLNATQFKDPMVWPVAAATTTTVNIMMKNAADRAAAAGQTLRPAVVYGKGYRFGVEGAFAANEAFKKVSGGQSIPGYDNPLTSPKCDKRFCGISPEVGQYGNQVSLVKDACQMGTTSECNFMILLLEPKTAQDWMAVPGVITPAMLSARGFSMAGPQPLFTFDFGRNCGDRCDGLWLWTGYNPPIDRYKSVPQVSAFVSDLKAQSASADEFNQFTMGGYIGMQLLIDALNQVGPNLTRAALVAKLNSMAPLETGLTSPLQWTGSARYANHSAQAFKIDARNGFAGWVLQQDSIRDIWLGQHTG